MLSILKQKKCCKIDETVSSNITETIDDKPISLIKQTIPILMDIESMKMRLNDKFLLK